MKIEEKIKNLITFSKILSPDTIIIKLKDFPCLERYVNSLMRYSFSIYTGKRFPELKGKEIVSFGVLYEHENWKKLRNFGFFFVRNPPCFYFRNSPWEKRNYERLAIFFEELKRRKMLGKIRK